MKISKNPTTVMTANGEVQTREEGTENVKEMDLIVTVMLLEETPAILSLGKLCEDHEYTYQLDQRSKNHISPKMAREMIAKNQTMYHSWLLVYQGVPVQRPHLLHHLHHRILWSARPATERSEIMSEESRGNPSRGSAETENTKIKMKTTK